MDFTLLFQRFAEQPPLILGCGYIQTVGNATLGGVPAYTDISTNTSVIVQDTAGTTVTGSTYIYSGQTLGEQILW